MYVDNKCVNKYMKNEKFIQNLGSKTGIQSILFWESQVILKLIKFMGHWKINNYL